MGKNTIREIYKLKSVARWAKKSSFSDENLLSAIYELEAGLVDADYGEGMFKKRVEIPGRGKSAGWRIVLAKREVVDNGPEQFVRWLLLLGFSKHEQDNIKQHEVDKLKTLAKGIFDLSDCDFDKAVSNGLLIKVIEGDAASEEE